MAARFAPPLLLLLLLLLISSCSCLQLELSSSPSSSSASSRLSRDDFPPGFVFGAGTSAYQVEGAAAEDGRGPSIWDSFTHAGNMADGSTGDVTADQYHNFAEDVKLMKETGLGAYRFSFSWSRLIPAGRGDVNPRGVAYYNHLIDQLLMHGIQPHVTLFHMDLPQALEDEYQGWLSPRIVDDFAAYADVCFGEFGDRVSHWTTINEPNVMSLGSYDNGLLPPRRCSPPFGIVNCTAGDSTVEPYVAVHHALLAHGAAVHLYRTKYQAEQNGWIGANVYTFWCRPFTNSSADVEATKRALDFYVGCILNPLVYGDYPEVMKRRVGSRLPSFTEEQRELVKGSFDFVGINHYATLFVRDNPRSAGMKVRDFVADMAVVLSGSKDVDPAASGQFVPTSMPLPDASGLQDALEYVTHVYGAPLIYVHENGFADPYNSSLNDTMRKDALEGYIGAVLAAIRNGSYVRGYFVWSFVDVFELLTGYRFRFGLFHVDFEDERRRRRPKLSARWYRDFLSGGGGGRGSNVISRSPTATVCSFA